MQIQAYLDNIFDVGALLEDTETKNAILEHIEDLQEEVGQVGGLTKQMLWTTHILRWSRSSNSGKWGGWWPSGHQENVFHPCTWSSYAQSSSLLEYIEYSLTLLYSFSFPKHILKTLILFTAHWETPGCRKWIWGQNCWARETAVSVSQWAGDPESKIKWWAGMEANRKVLGELLIRMDFKIRLGKEVTFFVISIPHFCSKLRLLHSNLSWYWWCVFQFF